MEQELLIERHLLDGDELFVAPEEKKRLVLWVARNHPNHVIAEAEMDLENVSWKLNLKPVTVTT